ncbi:MAG: hypothetical protein AABZ39_08735 [Spirochaetota bacterium]
MEAIITVIVIAFVIISGVMNARRKRGEGSGNEFPDDVDAEEQLRRVFSAPVEESAPAEETAEDDEAVAAKNDFEKPSQHEENIWDKKIVELRKKQAEAEQYSLKLHHIAASSDTGVRRDRPHRIDLSPAAIREGIIYSAILERRRPVRYRAKRS